MSRLYINPTVQKMIEDYCKLNSINDVNAFANRCALQGLSILKFGENPKDNVHREKEGINDYEKKKVKKEKTDGKNIEKNNVERRDEEKRSEGSETENKEESGEQEKRVEEERSIKRTIKLIRKA